MIGGGRSRCRLPPPSEPYERISRIRLSSWWFTCKRIDGSRRGLWPRSTAHVRRNRRLASFHPLFEGRQHALGPDTRFHPRPAGSDVSGLCSPCGHCRRSWFRLSVLHAFHLPAPLRSTPITGASSLAMGALTPASRSRLFGSSSMNTALCPLRRSRRFTCTAFQPFRLHPPDSPLRRFRTLPLSSQGLRRFAGGLDFAIEKQARRSARPYRVRHPTDWSFTSRCFGPHLVMTPFRLVSGRRAHA